MNIDVAKLLALIIEAYGPVLKISKGELEKDMSKWAIALDVDEKEDGSFDNVILSLVEQEEVDYLDDDNEE